MASHSPLLKFLEVSSEEGDKLLNRVIIFINFMHNFDFSSSFCLLDEEPPLSTG